MQPVLHLFAGLFVFFASTLLAQAQQAKPFVHPLFSNHMVLQRDKPIKIWGWAVPGERINVLFRDKPTGSVVANDAGRWEATIGPFAASSDGSTLRIQGKEQELTILDVLVGEVWVCSGQSNMEWPVRLSNNPQKEIADANYPSIRLFTVPKRISVSPQESLDGRWMACSTESIPNFSAVGYYFGRKLNQELGLPIGLIHTSWGGTVAEAWTSGESLKAKMPEFADSVRAVEIAAAEGDDAEKYNQRVEAWWNKNDPGSAEDWSQEQFAASDWEVMQLPNNWENVVTELKTFDGIMWFRKTFELPKDWIPSGEAMLKLGPIDDADTTWVNGKQVGSMSLWTDVREYEIPETLLKPGKNSIAVRVFDGNGGGGIYGKNYPMAVRLSDDSSISLVGPWSYKAGRKLSDLPRFPQRMNSNPNVTTVLHNGMLRPIQPFGIRGAIWYQGESNAGRATQYRTLLPTMIEDWREGFGQGDFPFLVVQLANFMAKQTTPVQTGWAELREAQAIAAQRDKNVGLAIITDIGEANDIHPRNKQDVGIRLALQALNMSYGKSVVDSGPTLKDMAIVGSTLHIEFSNVGGGLEIRGDQLQGFAIAERDGEFVWAEAEVDGNKVILSHPDLAEPIRVRYNWANNPVGNLFNKEGLPAAPFRTDRPR